jgi:hypothetical protein
MAGRGQLTWKFLSTLVKTVTLEVTVLPEPFAIVAAKEKPNGPAYPCLLVGLDFRSARNPVVLLSLTGNKWQQWNQRVDLVFDRSISETEVKTKDEWEVFRDFIDTLNYPVIVKKRLAEIKARLTDRPSPLNPKDSLILSVM